MENSICVLIAKTPVAHCQASEREMAQMSAAIENLITRWHSFTHCTFKMEPIDFSNGNFLDPYSPKFERQFFHHQKLRMVGMKAHSDRWINLFNLPLFAATFTLVPPAFLYPEEIVMKTIAITKPAENTTYWNLARFQRFQRWTIWHPCKINIIQSSDQLAHILVFKGRQRSFTFSEGHKVTLTSIVPVVKLVHRP